MISPARRVTRTRKAGAKIGRMPEPMTSPDQNSKDPRRDEVIAGEYVLGVLSAEDRRKVEVRLQSDRTFAAMVNRWEENLSAINTELETMSPPMCAYTAVDQRFFEAPLKDASGARRSVWTSLAFWRSAAFLAIAFSAALLALGPDIFAPAPPQQAIIAELSGPDGPISLMARYDASRGLLTMTAAASRQDGGKSLELWLVEDGGTPVSLGVLSQSGDGALTVPEALRPRIRAGAVLSVSVEPLGGSPTGAATGPVIATGQARRF